MIEPLNNDDAYNEYLANYSQREEGTLFTYADELEQKVTKEIEKEPVSPDYSVDLSYTEAFNYNPEEVFVSPQTTNPKPPEITDNLKYTPEGLFTIGKATVYPDYFEGRKTANGETYNGSSYTCAHNKYPLGRYLKVTRKSNPNLSIIVQVTDSQPGIMDYDIQLSWAAASDLEVINGFDRDVVVEEISVTDLDALPQLEYASAGGGIGPQRTIEIDFFDGSASLRGESAIAVSSPLNTEKTMRGEGFPVAQSTETAAKATGGLGLFKLEASRTPENGYGIQIAVVSQYREILEISDKLYSNGVQNTMVHSDIVGEKEVLRYIVGPFYSKEEAETTKTQLENANIYGMIIRLEPLK